MGISLDGTRSRGADRLTKFTHGNRLKDFISKQLLDRTIHPLKVKTPTWDYDKATANRWGTITHDYNKSG